MGWKFRLSVICSLAMLVAACGGASDGSDDGEGTPFEGIGDAAEEFESGGFPQAGAVTVTADPSSAWVEVDGQRLEFSSTSSEQLDCIINDEQLSVIYKNDDGSEIRLSGLLLPDGWNLSLSVTAANQDNLMNGAGLRSGSFGIGDNALSYEGAADVMEGGAVVSQPDVTLAANCNT